MSLLNQIKKDQLQARKARDSQRAALLTTLISEAEKVGKDDGNRETTSSEVIKVIKKFIKNLNEVLDVTKSEVTFSDTQHELRILESYLPQQLDEVALTTLIQAIIDANEITNMKGMGTVMKELKAHHDGEYEGKMASDIVKKLLSN